MLVRQLAGPFAGQNIHMNGLDARLAKDAGTARDLTPQEFEEHGIRTGYGHGMPKDEEVVIAVEAARPPEPVSGQPKRRGGWPLGKPRGPRVKPAVLA